MTTSPSERWLGFTDDQLSVLIEALHIYAYNNEDEILTNISNDIEKDARVEFDRRETK